MESPSEAPVPKAGRQLWRCSQEGCGARVAKLAQHLSGVHGLVPGSVEYRIAKSRCEKTSAVLQERSATGTDGSTSLEQDPPAAERRDDQPARQHPPRSCKLDLARDTRKPFLAWLRTLSGGLRRRVPSRQHASQALALASLAGKGRCPECVGAACERSVCPAGLNAAVEMLRFDERGVVVRQAGTIASYLTSYELYVSYLAQCHPDAFEERQLELVRSQMRAWKRPLQRAKLARKVERDAAQEAAAFKRRDVKKFLASKSTRSALAMLKDDSAKIRPRQSRKLRNILLALVLLQCPVRSGALAAMTLGNLRSALPVTGPKGTVCFVVSIPSHKTATSYGPAKLVLTERVHRALQRYVRRARPQDAPTGDGAAVFLNSKGSPLTAAAVSDGLRRAWCGEMGNEHKKYVTATLVRKYAATRCAEEKPLLAEQAAATIFGHSYTTHRRSYRLPPSSSRVATLAAGVREAMGTADEDAMSATEQCASEDEAETTVEWFGEEDFDDDMAPAPTAPTTAPVPTPAPSPGFRFDTPDLVTTVPDSSSPPNSHGRHKLLPEERLMISEAFASDIEARKISLRAVRRIAASHEGISRVVSRTSENTVFERVRYDILCRQAHSDATEELDPSETCLVPPLSPHV